MRHIWEQVDPNHQGDPTLIVRAVKEGLLEGTDSEIEVFSNMLWLALDLDPDGITDYILQALAEGKFSEAQRDLLNKEPPLPIVTAPAFSRLAAGYVKAFASTWGSGLRGIPYTYKRIRYFSPEVRTRTVQALSKCGPEGIRVAALLYPSDVAAIPGLALKSLAMLEDQPGRLALLDRAFAMPDAHTPQLSTAGLSRAEQVIASLSGGIPLPDSNQAYPPVTQSDLLGMLEVLKPSVLLYQKVGTLNDPQIREGMKTEIIRHMAQTNLVAATRALADDPDPPDQAIALAVQAMADDPGAAQAWTARIRSPEIKAQFNIPPDGPRP